MSTLQCAIMIESEYHATKGVVILSHIAWDRTKSVVVCLSVCLSVCPWTRLRSHFSTNLHEIWQEPLGSEKEELIRFGSKSENAFPNFNPKTNFTAEIGNSQPNVK